MIGYGRQHIDEDDIQSVLDVLKSDLITQGPAVLRFEKALARYCDSPHCIAVANGTTALYLGYAALGVTRNSRVWVPAITFVATANAARMLGATVEFIEVEANTGNLDLTALANSLHRAKAEGRLPDVVTAVHLTGRSVDMKSLNELAKAFGFLLVEDACHALGADYAGKAVGYGEYSAAVCFSFHPVKSITSGEGGAVMTRCEKTAKRVRQGRHHGFGETPEAGTHHRTQTLLGCNGRLSDIHAALGWSQMRRLDEFIAHRRQLVKHYEQLLSGIKGLLRPAPSAGSAWHLYSVRLCSQTQRDDVLGALANAGFSAGIHYAPPVYRQPYYRAEAPDLYLPGAEDYAARTLSLPLFPGLSLESLSKVATVLRQELAASKSDVGCASPQE